MTQYQTNFMDSDVGDDPPAFWTRRGDAAVSPSTYPFLVRNNSALPFKHRSVAMTNPGVSPNPVISWDSLDSDSNRAEVEVCGISRVDPDASTQSVLLIARGQGASTITDGYELDFYGPSQVAKFYKVSAGVRTQVGSTIFVNDLADDAAIKIVFKVSGTSPTTLRAKFWSENTDEPTDWTAEETDSSGPITAAGWIGFGLGRVDVSPSLIFEQSSQMSWFSVGTDGDDAPRPVTNAEFSAWLRNQTRQRRVLAKLPANGYDTVGSPGPNIKTVYAYIGNGGYTSRSFDDPPNQNFRPCMIGVPGFSREMGVALSGKAVTSFGSIRVKNPARQVVTYKSPAFDLAFTDAGSGAANTTPAAGIGSVTFTRTGATATTVLSSQLISGTIAADTLRSYYNPTNGEYWGAIFEEERTNRRLRSGEFENAAWGKSGLTGVTANAAIGPDGTMSADLSVENSVLTTHLVEQFSSASANIVHASSVYLKAATRGFARHLLYDATVNGYGQYVNLTTGATALTSVGTVSSTSRGIKKHVSGWWRSHAVGSMTTANSGHYINISLSMSVGSEFYSGDGASGILYAAAQHEAGSYPTTYIPTAGSTATRAKDLLTFPVSGNLPTNDFVIATDWRPMAAAMGTVYLGGSYVDASNYTRIFHDGTNIVVRKRIAGVNYDATKALAYTAEMRYQIVARFSSTTGVDVFVDGVKGTNQADTTACQLGTTWQHMADGNGVVAGAMCCKLLTAYDSALNDGEIYNLFNGQQPQQSVTISGERDDWTRVKWKKDRITVLLGDDDWALCQFRPVIVGRLGQVTSPSHDVLEFPIQDLSGLLDVPLQENRFLSGPNEDQTKPLGFGAVAWSELSVISDTALTYQVNDGPVFLVGGTAQTALYDNGNPLFVAKNVSSVSTGADTLTSVGHGMLDDWRVVMSVTSGFLPSPLVDNVLYWVVGATADTFQLSLTEGGSPENLTTSGSGVISFVGYGYSINTTTGVATLVSTPAGRISARSLYFGTSSAQWNPAVILSDIIFGTGALSENDKDSDAFDDLESTVWPFAGIQMLPGESPTVAEFAQRACTGLNLFYGWTPDGLMRPGQISLPTSDPVLTLTESDVTDLRLETVMLPIDFGRSVVRYDAPFATSDLLFKTGSVFTQVRARTAGAYNYGSGGIPLDNYPTLSDSVVRNFDLLYSISDLSTEVARLAELFRVKLGVFKFKTRFSAIELAIGQTIRLTHSKLGWKVWTADDPASPDNLATVDSTVAVVIGVATSLQDNTPFPVTLTVFRRIPGYYPESDLS